MEDNMTHLSHKTSRSHKKLTNRILFFMLFILCFVLLSLIIIYIPPTSTLIIAGVPLSPLPFFLMLTFGLFLAISALLFNTVIHGILIGLFLVCYLLLRVNDLAHPFFLILLSAIFLTIELMISSRK